MKLIRTAILLAALAIGTASAQDKPKGYDVGACAPDRFVAAHFEVGTDISITLVSPGPGVVEKPDHIIVYKFSKSDEKGKHYINGAQDLIIAEQSEKGIVGELDVDGKSVAAIFGVPGDGSKLAENAMKEFEACGEVLSEPDPKPAPDVT